jgi:hypothetical protein
MFLKIGGISVSLDFKSSGTFMSTSRSRDLLILDVHVNMIIMVISALLKWYVEHDLKVTQIHQVVEYKPATCFEKFGDNIGEARRAGDADPEKNVSSPEDIILSYSLWLQ